MAGAGKGWGVLSEPSTSRYSGEPPTRLRQYQYEKLAPRMTAGGGGGGAKTCGKFKLIVRKDAYPLVTGEARPSVHLDFVMARVLYTLKDLSHGL